MAGDDWHYWDLGEMGGRIHAGDISPVEAAQAQLDRIEALDGELHSYATVMAGQALEAARAAEREIAAGRIRGPLHGVPIAVKDLCWTADAPTAAGMPIHRDFRPKEDATVVRKLREAGAVILGKLQLTEGAYADHHPDIVAPVNPWNPLHWSGASSSGSGVATAAGLCYASLGTDTGGSIRFPSAANGCTGLKPSWGRVSRYGTFELAATLDHIGPMTRSAADAAVVLNAIAGEDPSDPTAARVPVPDYASAMGQGLQGLRVGIDPRWNGLVDARTKEMMDEAGASVAELGGALREIRVPDTEQMVADWFVLCGIEAAVAHESTFPAQESRYGPGLKGLIQLGRSQDALAYQKIVLRRLAFRGRIAALFADIDLLLVPTTAMASPTVALMATLGETPELISGLLRYTCPFDMSGNPTITLPGGFTAQDTPVAFQFVADHFREDLLFRAGHAYQQATDWHRRHPSM